MSRIQPYAEKPVRVYTIRTLTECLEKRQIIAKQAYFPKQISLNNSVRVTHADQQLKEIKKNQYEYEPDILDKTNYYDIKYTTQVYGEEYDKSQILCKKRRAKSTNFYQSIGKSLLNLKEYQFNTPDFFGYSPKCLEYKKQKSTSKSQQLSKSSIQKTFQSVNTINNLILSNNNIHENSNMRKLQMSQNLKYTNNSQQANEQVNHIINQKQLNQSYNTQNLETDKTKQNQKLMSSYSIFNNASTQNEHKTRSSKINTQQQDMQNINQQYQTINNNNHNTVTQDNHYEEYLDNIYQVTENDLIKQQLNKIGIKLNNSPLVQNLNTLSLLNKEAKINYSSPDVHNTFIEQNKYLQKQAVTTKHRIDQQIEQLHDQIQTNTNPGMKIIGDLKMFQPTNQQNSNDIYKQVSYMQKQQELKQQIENQLQNQYKINKKQFLLNDIDKMDISKKTNYYDGEFSKSNSLDDKLNRLKQHFEERKREQFSDEISEVNLFKHQNIRYNNSNSNIDTYQYDQTNNIKNLQNQLLLNDYK